MKIPVASNDLFSMILNMEMNTNLLAKLKLSQPLWNGIQHIFKFDNGFGASVVRHENSYGGTEGLWEIAVLDKKDNITCETPITDDVLGWLEWEKVLDILWEISKLPEV